MMMALRPLIPVMTILLLLAGPHPTQAADAQIARATVQAAVDDGLTTFLGQTHSLPERARLLDGLLRRYTDPTMLAASLLGRHWGKITPAEQAAFTDTFMRYLVSSYVGLLKNIQPGVKVDIGEAVDQGSRVKVASIAYLPSQPGAPVPVEWDVATTADGKPVLMDVTAEGVSIIRAMREDFASVLRGSGGRIDPLMEALRRKIDANDKDNVAGQ
ncbi:MAG: ABC transporter substrate-binding protein [Magnetospirillum sp.]|nr:MAG: ABC transporter substrate-binding protein [Magnetospirillum sp.]